MAKKKTRKKISKQPGIPKELLVSILNKWDSYFHKWQQYASILDKGDLGIATNGTAYKFKLVGPVTVEVREDNRGNND